MGNTRPAAPPLKLGWKGKSVLASIAAILIIGVFLMLQETGGSAKAELPSDVQGICSIEYIDTAVLPGTEIASGTTETTGAPTELEDDGEGAAATGTASGIEATAASDITLGDGSADQTALDGNAPEGDNGIPEEVEDIALTQPVETLPIGDGTTAVDDSSAQLRNVYKVTMPDGKKTIVYGTSEGYVPKDGDYRFSGTARSDKAYNVVIETSYDAQSAADVHEQSAADFEKDGAGKTQQLDMFIWSPSDDYAAQNGTNSDPAGVAGDAATEEEVTVVATPQDDSAVIMDKAAENDFAMALSATALDSVTHLHEGCAYQDDVTIDVEFKYENLFADTTFAIKGQLVDQFNMNPILGANGQPITFDVPFETKGAYNETEEDKRANEQVAEFLSIAKAILDASATAEQDPDAAYKGELPTYEQVEKTVQNAVNNGSKALTEDDLPINELYSYYNSLTDAQKAQFGTLPEFPELVNIVIAAHNATAARYASGTVEFTVSAPASSAYAKKVMVALSLYLDGNEISKVYEHNEDAVSVVYPGITTEATVYGEHSAAATKGIVIMDTVHYVGLVPGVQYHLETNLIEKSTQSLVVDSTSGESVREMTEFTPMSSSGVVNVTLPAFDATSMKGRDSVVFEKLVRCVEVNEGDAGAEVAINAENVEAEGGLHSTQMGTAVVIHKDLNDKYQTISFDKDHWEAGEVEQGGTLSAMGDDAKPFIFGGLIVLALIGIGAMRMRSSRY